MRRALAASFMLALLASTAVATDKTDKKALDETLLALHSSEAKRRDLQEESQKLERELTGLQKETVTLAATLRDKEKDLSALEETLRTMEKDYTARQREFSESEHRLSSVLQGMVRISRTPEGAVIALPGEYEKTLKTAKMLGITSNALQQKSQQLKEQIAEMDRLKSELETTRTTLTREKKTAEEAQNTLHTRLAERKKLQEKIFFEQRSESQRIADLSAKSKNLRELMASLEQSRPTYNRKKPIENNEFEVASLPDVTDAPPSLRSFSAAKGRVKAPVAGKLAHRFGDKKGAEEAYKGVVIATRQGAQVTSPFDGEVVFTGPFLDYGKLIIIRHSDNFHTLLAGVEEIQCAPGQFLLEGEPIGAMNREDNSATSLYMELRQNGKPIDPAPWVSAGL